MFQSKRQWEKLLSMEMIKWTLINENDALGVASSAIFRRLWAFLNEPVLPLDSHGKVLSSMVSRGLLKIIGPSIASTTHQPTTSHEDLRVFRVEAMEAWGQDWFSSDPFCVSGGWTQEILPFWLYPQDVLVVVWKALLTAFAHNEPSPSSELLGHTWAASLLSPCTAMF